MRNDLIQIKTPDELTALRIRAKTALDGGSVRIVVCGGTGCSSNGSKEVYDAIKTVVDERDIPVRVDLLDE